MTLAIGIAEKAKEFVDKGSEIYQGNLVVEAGNVIELLSA
jgi:hypothetical protein